MNAKEALSKKRRKNARMFASYKMISWDLLCFYSIQFLFYTRTKGITASEVLIVEGIYLIARILMQFPAIRITEKLGRKKSIVCGNIILIIYLLLLIIGKGVIGIVIADLFCALGFDIKALSETVLLYDSVATKGGGGLYTKIDSKGSSMYFMLDGICAMCSGYLFVYNNYLPIIICLCFIVVSTILSLKFSDIRKAKQKVKSEKQKEQGNEEIKTKKKEKTLLQTFKFILKSRRMQALVLFGIVFTSLFKSIDIYDSDILLSIGITAEQFTMIMGIFSIMGGFAISLQEKVQRRRNNRKLKYLSLTYVSSCILIGIITSYVTSNIAIPWVLMLMGIQKMERANWLVLENKYLKNFTKEKNRSKLTFAYSFITILIAGTFAILAGLLLNKATIQTAFLLVSIAGFGAIVLVLDFMKTRIGLKPSKYNKEDINF